VLRGSDLPQDMGQALAADRVLRSTISETQGSNLSAILWAADLLYPCFTRPGLRHLMSPSGMFRLWPLNLNERTKLLALIALLTAEASTSASV
jgi:hypothetical protein